MTSQSDTARQEPAAAALDRLLTAIKMEARNNLFSGDELQAATKLTNDIAGYIERATGKPLDGAAVAGIGHIIRKTALPWLAQRTKRIEQAAAALKQGRLL